MRQNLHTHSVFCDGQDTPADIARAAYEAGLDSLGFSSHSITTELCGQFPLDVPRYISEVNALKSEYEGKMKIYLGCEMDEISYGKVDPRDFEFTIGAVHEGTKCGKTVFFDYSIELAKKHIDELFGGSFIEFARMYYDILLNSRAVAESDIVAHFDLVSKYSERMPTLFNADTREYREVALDTLHTVRNRNELFEINTGVLARGYKTHPYPAPFLLKEMKALDCKLLITSDCHNKDFITYGFDTAKEIIKSHGFDSLYYLTDDGFVGEKI